MPDRIEEKKSGRHVGYWAAHEQYSMHDLLKFVVEAEKCGFNATMTSDHFHPWWHDNAFGNFTWVWIAAAAARTNRMRFITGVTAPIYRYHPAVIAQAFASLDVLYPGRIGLGLGTGEAMNEVPLGFNWPKPSARLKRTVEALKIIRKLWGMSETPTNSGVENKDESGFVDFNGEYFLIRQAKLYTAPTGRIPIYLAAAGPESTRAAAKFSDGLITFLNPQESVGVIDIFDKMVKRVGRDPSSVEKIAEYKLSFSEDYDKAFQSSVFWRATMLKNAFNTDISDPRKLERKAKEKVPDETLNESIDIITSIEDSMKSIENYFKAGFTTVYVHSTSPDEAVFVRSFGKKILPYFTSR